jgi:hypothetical protein
MNPLIKQFPDGTVTRKKDKVMWAEPKGNHLTKSFKQLLGALVVVLGFVVMGIVILILMGALKFFGVKEL